MRGCRHCWPPIALFALLSLQGCAHHGPQPGTVLDEAARANLSPEAFHAATEDYFRDMDYNVVRGGRPVFTQREIEGRNMWMVWTAGDDRLWDVLTVSSIGTFDLLKTISSHPAVLYDDPHKEPGDKPKYLYGYGRHNRFKYLGLVSEPCFTEAKGPDPAHFGLWLDQRDPACPPDPFADPVRYPGVKIGARGKTIDVGSYYGEPTGIVGLRLFPNPAFDEEARRRWSAERFYNDPAYYGDKDLVRPYRVGMSCGFCHVGPNPINPPPDPENPKWEHLSSNVGAQFFWWDRVFNWRADAFDHSIFYQALHVSRPGTLDTSLVSTDNINNPRTMNAVYQLRPRLLQAHRFGRETIAGGGLNNKQFNNYVPPSDPLAQFFAPPSTTWTPRVLKDGSDSVGALGALNRVYINIGLFSEEWLLHFRAIIGGKAISPIPIETAERNSVYWRATEMQTPDMARFFLASTDPHLLKDAPGGPAYLTETPATVERGKVVFAERCARCHSSKLPPVPTGIDLENANGPMYLARWNEYWAWTKTDAFKSQMRAIVLAPDFLDDNYLSSEQRVPAPLLGINACSPLATNALRDNIWDNFSSESYKQLPSAGTMKIRHPVTKAEMDYVLPAGGRGYIRPASLVSLWSTAPYLQNNTVGEDVYAATSLGPYGSDPSVKARMDRFEKSIELMLWPEKRPTDDIFKGIDGPTVGFIDRMTATSWVDIPAGFVPDFLRPLIAGARLIFPFIRGSGGSVSIGPFPKGTPVGLMANMDLMGADLPESEQREHRKRLLKLLKDLKAEFRANPNPTEVSPKLVDELLALSKCKDFVVNKGHYFGTSYFPEEPGLSDDDKRALIAFLKTF
jgi:hypothetical protein